MTPKAKLVRLAEESAILAQQLMDGETIKIRNGAILTFLLARCGHHDDGSGYQGGDQLPDSLHAAVKALVLAQTDPRFIAEPLVLATALRGLATVIFQGLAEADRISKGIRALVAA